MSTPGLDRERCGLLTNVKELLTLIHGLVLAGAAAATTAAAAAATCLRGHLE